MLQGMASAAPNIPWMVGTGRTEAKAPSLWGGIRAQPALHLLAAWEWSPVPFRILTTVQLAWLSG